MNIVLPPCPPPTAPPPRGVAPMWLPGIVALAAFVGWLVGQPR